MYNLGLHSVQRTRRIEVSRGNTSKEEDTMKTKDMKTMKVWGATLLVVVAIVAYYVFNVTNGNFSMADTIVFGVIGLAKIGIIIHKVSKRTKTAKTV